MRNVLWGMSWGLGYAVVYSVIAVAVYSATRGAERAPGPTLGGLIVTYFILGVLAGALLGALRPFIRSKPGAAVAGLLVAVPVGFGFAVLNSGFRQMGRDDLVAVGLFALVGGPVGGVMLQAALRAAEDAES